MNGNSELAAQLRQMIAALETERQALADLDLDALVLAAGDKQAMCGQLDAITPHMLPHMLDADCRALVEAARQLNDVNRRVRNILAANVAARLDALGGRAVTYRPAEAQPA